MQNNNFIKQGEMYMIKNVKLVSRSKMNEVVSSYYSHGINVIENEVSEISKFVSKISVDYVVYHELFQNTRKHINALRKIKINKQTIRQQKLHGDSLCHIINKFMTMNNTNKEYMIHCLKMMAALNEMLLTLKAIVAYETLLKDNTLISIEKVQMFYMMLAMADHKEQDEELTKEIMGNIMARENVDDKVFEFVLWFFDIDFDDECVVA